MQIKSFCLEGNKMTKIKTVNYRGCSLNATTDGRAFQDGKEKIRWR